MADPTAGVKRATDPAARPVVPGQTAADTLPCTMRELLLYFLRLGTFGGQLMRLLNRAQQREIARLLGSVAGMDVLEVGHGPGVLLGLLARTARHRRP